MFDSFYFTIISLTSVGYGDKLPITYTTKVLVCFIGLSSAIVMSLLVAVLSNKLLLNHN